MFNQVLCGDALEILRTLPAESVDAGMTSPPYNKGENKKGWLVTNVKYARTSDKLPEAAYQQWQIEVLNEIWRVIKPGGSFFYNHKIRWERGVLLHPYSWLAQTRWVIRQEIIWDRMIAANLRGWRFWQVDERIYWLYKPMGKHLVGRELASRHALMTSIWRIKPERNSKHPAPFPLTLPLRAIYSVLDDEQDKIILDPFAGSGTTLLAAKILGHRYLGIEISSEYIALAEERLANWQKALPAAQDEMQKHKVKKTFKERKEKGEFTGRYGKKYKERQQMRLMDTQTQDD